MADLDELKVKISADTSDVDSKLKTLTEGITKLSTELSKLNSDKLSKFSSDLSNLKKSLPTEKSANSFKTVADGVKQIADACEKSADKIEKFSQGLDLLKDASKGFGKNSGGRLSEISVGIKEINDAISSMGSQNILAFGQAMQMLGNGMSAMKGMKASQITNMGNALNTVSQNAQNTAKEVKNAVNQINNAISSTESNPRVVNQGSGGLASGSKNILSQFNGKFGELEKATIQANKLQNALSKLGAIQPTKGMKKLEQQIETVRNKYETLRREIAEGIDSGNITDFDKEGKKLDALRNKYTELLLKQKELALEGQTFEISPRAKTTLEGVQVVANSLKRTFRGMSSIFKGLVSRVSDWAKSIKNARKQTFSLNDTVKKLSKEILRVSKMLKLMITRMALRKVIEETGNGFKSLALHSEKFNKTVSDLLNGSKKLGYSFAAMAEPLITALAPAIMYVINLLTQLVNAFNQVFSSILGRTTWNKAKDFTDSYADSISGATDKAKELKKTVMGFDELNQLQDNKQSSSGSSGSGIVDMFEDEPIESKYKDLADKIKKAWKTGDFYDLGKEFGDNLANFLANIDWDKIKANARKVGRSIATLLNGIMDGVADDGRKLSTLIGQTIAESLNTVFEALHEFVLNFNWKRLGAFIAETMNGLFDTIDWDLIKDTFIWGAKGLADGINSFIEEFNWDNISDTIANAVFALSGAIYTFFNTTDFDKLGHKLGEQLRLTIEKIDWETVGKALGSIVQSAIDFVGGFLEEQDWDTIKEAIKELLKGFFEAVDKEDLAPILFTLITAAVLKAVGDLAIWGAGKYIAGALFGNGFKSAASTMMASTAKDNAMLGSVSVAGTGLGTAFVTAFWGAVAWYGGSVAGNSIGKYLFPEDKELYEQYEGLSGIIQLYKDFGIAIKDDIEMKIENSKQSKYANMTLGESIEAMNESKDATEKSTIANMSLADGIMAIEDASYNAKQTINESTEKIKENGTSISDLQNNYKNYTNSVGETIGKVKEQKSTFDESIKGFENYKKATDDAKQVNDTLKSSVENASKSMPDFNEKMKLMESQMDSTSSKASETGTNIVKGIEDPIKNANTDETANGFFSNLWKSICGVFGISSPAKEMKPIGNNIFNGILVGFREQFGEFTTTIGDFFNNRVKPWFSKDRWTFGGVANGLRQTFKDAIQGIRDMWNSWADGLSGTSFNIGGSQVRLSLPHFSSGGFPEDGLFMANHNEMVGQFSNGKTAVANNEQIISGIEQGVFNAMSMVMSNQNSSGERQFISTTINLDGKAIATAISEENARINRRYNPRTT